MADFLANLWESVFTPGPTSTLLVATNITFGALQIVLFALLVATYSIHFVILSFLCGGLWYSINWFAAELRAAQSKELEAERLRKRKRAESDWKAKSEAADSADDEGEDTEVEGGLKDSTASLWRIPSDEARADDSRISGSAKTPGLAHTSGASSGLQAGGTAGGSRQRKAEESDRSGEISTDSEWEKVDDGR